MRHFATFEGTFRLSAQSFPCALLEQGAFCVSDDDTVSVTIKESGELNSGRAPEGGYTFPPGGRRDLDPDEVLLNAPRSVACGSQGGGTVWCIAIESGKGFLVDGSSAEFTRLARDR
ncbi:MAG: hypothetical protein QOD86_2220 [Miltoncostaeaceae bacterium]|nr:hypothetical protein [Miltoncostaeaceae bacterium]